MTTDNPPISIAELIDWSAKNTLQWGDVDVVGFGDNDGISRWGQFAAAFYCARDTDKNPLARQVTLILPRYRNLTAEDVLERLRRGFAAALSHMAGSQLSAKFIDNAFAQLTMTSTISFDGDELLGIIARASDREALLVGDTSYYRVHGVSPLVYEDDEFPEDIWSAHFCALLQRAADLSGASGCYVLADLGVPLPSRDETRALLFPTGKHAVAGFVSDISPTVRRSRIAAWLKLAESGQVGKALSEVNDDSTLDERQRFIFELELWLRADLSHEAARLLDERHSQLHDLSSAEALVVAGIAETADRNDLAEQLLSQAIPDLRSSTELERALHVAISTRRAQVIDQACTALKSTYPRSKALRRHLAGIHALAGKYLDAIEELRLADGDDTQRLAFYAFLADKLPTNECDNFTELLSSAIKGFPALEFECAQHVVAAMERAGRFEEAITLMLASPKSGSQDNIALCLRCAERGLAAGLDLVASPAFGRLVERSIALIADNPQASEIRLLLDRCLSAEMSGGRGMTMLVEKLVKATNGAFDRPADTTTIDDDDLSDQETRSMVVRCLDWLQQESHGHGVMGRQTMPADVLKVSPHRAMQAILRLTEYTCLRLNDERDVALLYHLMSLSSSIAPLTPDHHEDLTVLRTVAGRFALTGRGQMARDLAEQALTLAGADPQRRRISWFTYADIYARLGHRREAVLAQLAALTASTRVSWAQAWYETYLMVRLMRDLKMTDMARSMLAVAKRVLEGQGRGKLDAYRLETIRLQLELFELDPDAPDQQTTIISLLADASLNAEDVLTHDDDAAPISFVIGELLRMAEDAGIQPDAAQISNFKRLRERVSPAIRRFLEASGPEQSASHLAAVAASIDPARFADDIGFDVRHVRTVAARLAAKAAGADDAVSLMYAVEAGADQSVQPAGAHVQANLLHAGSAPLDAAICLVQQGISVTGLAISNNRLVQIDVTGSAHARIHIEMPEVFSSISLDRWSMNYPHEYAYIDSETFAASLSGLGLTSLPERTLIVPSGKLMRVPPNILEVDGQFAGRDHRLAVTPSLNWLMANRSRDVPGNGIVRAWIPWTDNDAAPLSLLRENLADVLASHDVAIDPSPEPSISLSQAEVAIIAGHGGLATTNRYFRSFTNDDHRGTSVLKIADLTRRSRLVILFVCSGGRVDPDPESGAGIGLARRLLARGTQAVIAPPWPVPVFIARPWLKAFLPLWRSGCSLIDCCYLANQAIGEATSHDPNRYLAMTLYGNPFISTGPGSATPGGRR